MLKNNITFFIPTDVSTSHCNYVSNAVWAKRLLKFGWTNVQYYGCMIVLCNRYLTCSKLVTLYATFNSVFHCRWEGSTMNESLRQRTSLYTSIYVERVYVWLANVEWCIKYKCKTKATTPSLPRSLIKTSFTMKDVVPLLWDEKITIYIHRATIIIAPNCFTFNLTLYFCILLYVCVCMQNIYTKEKRSLYARFHSWKFINVISNK